jgi:hypothetical protein
MRYTKAALLLFGLGMILGLVVVAGEFVRFERAAALLMALGLLLLPVALIADGRGLALVARMGARLSVANPAKPHPKVRAATGRRASRPRAAAHAKRRARR